MQILVEQGQVEGIPTLTMARADQRTAPVVIWTPGYSAGKEQGLTLGYKLAAAGFYFVAYDPIHHGARADGSLFPAPDACVFPPETGLDTWLVFCRVIEQCLADMRTLLKALHGDDRADMTRVGVSGLSMGGCVAALAFAALPQVTCAVPMIGVPTLARRWRDLLDECALSSAAWADALAQRKQQTDAAMAWIEGFDASPRLTARAPLPLFFMNCDFDHDQPKQYAIDAVRTLRPAWAAQPERLRLGLYPAGHTVTPAMENDAVDWCNCHLHPNTLENKEKP